MSPPTDYDYESYGNRQHSRRPDKSQQASYMALFGIYSMSPGTYGATVLADGTPPSDIIKPAKTSESGGPPRPDSPAESIHSTDLTDSAAKCNWIQDGAGSPARDRDPQDTQTGRGQATPGFSSIDGSRTA